MKFRDFLTEKVTGKVIVVYGGGFQPFHQGHMSSYVESKQKFPRADYYVAASGDVKVRPIPFADKKFLAQQAGVVDNFVQVVQPLNPQEILKNYNEDKDILILVRSEKDVVKYTKKDGSPAYYQPFVSIDKCESFKKHAYVFMTKKKIFRVAGKQVDSGSQIRKRYMDADDKTKRQMIADLYPKAKNPAKVKTLLDKYLVVQEDVDMDFEEFLDEAFSLGKTFDFIRKAHKGQKYGDVDYWNHPKSVAFFGKKFFKQKFDNKAMQAALLHDVIEDTPYSDQQLIKMGFGKDVIDAVKLLTKNKSLSYEDNIRKIIASGNKTAMMVKFADNFKNYTGDKSNWPEEKKQASQKKYRNSLEMLAQKLGVRVPISESNDVDFEQFLIEGVHDQGIFKAVFLAGGPGSGKDYVLDNTLQGHGLTEINLDKASDFLKDKKGPGRAKNMTEVKQRLAIQGRNGLIINGMGDDLNKVADIKKQLEDLGYDTTMIMVNTSDEVSAQRNIERGQRGGRTVPETTRKEKWDSAQNARTEYAKMFGANYMEFDNSEDLREAPPEVVKQKKEELMQIFKNIKDFVSQPPQSENAQAWVADQMQQKDTQPVPKGGSDVLPHPESNASEEAKKLGLQYYGFGRYGRNGEVTHRSVHDKLVEVQKQIKEDIDEELLDEFRTIDSYSKKELDDKFKEFTKNKGRFRKLIRTPLSNDFDVYYSGAGDFHKYIFTEKNTDVAVGEFELDVVDYIRPEFVKPGIKIVTPHLFFSEKYQRKGLARKTYLAFLRMKNYVFMTDRHTQEAATLWNSLAKERDIITFYYDDREEEVSKHTEYEYKFLGLKSDFKLPKHILEDINELFAEDLRNWFNPKHPEGGWKRINSKGEAIGPCARKPGEPKPKCMSNEKRAALSKKERAAAVRAKRKHDPNPERKGDPINVSNFGKGKISESYALSDSSAMNLLLLGNDVDEQNLYFNGENDNYDFSEEASKVKLLRDKSGKVRTFMLRRAAAKEAHTINGTVMPYKNGYVIKLNEENNNVRISEESVQTKTIDRWRQTSIGRINSSRGEKILNEGVAELTSGQEYAKGTGIETTPTQASGQGKITLQQIRQRKTVLQKERERSGSSVNEDTKQINEIDKGIEPGLSMATGGENATRLAPKNKAVKKPFEEAIGAGGEMATSMSDNEELKLKRKGIDLQSFKAKRPIG